MVMSLRSKWAVGEARGGRISQSIRNRRATQPPAHFQRNPPDLRRHHHSMRDGTLGASDDISGGVGPETRPTSAPRQIDDNIASGADKFFGPRVKNTKTYIFNSS